ncbi:hypothetical protein [Ferrimonas balearica]|uniref:hypothetical protein n=1 Tax=Ferrimonas balearica TaxID=44012 RepID=UPI001C991DB9|nr:hypothetical protein [Ferrimonas balearica]MBY5991211.1 hypothetical protein [Ferrimonas balearica]
MRKLNQVIFILSLFFISTGVSASVCDPILKAGVHDKYSTFTNRQKFTQTYNLIASQEFDSWEKAKSSGAEIGVNVIDIIDVALGGSSTQQNYGDRRNKYLSISFDSLVSKFGYLQHLEVASSTIAQAFVRCIELTSRDVGFTAWIVPGRNLATFAINARNVKTGGDANFTVQKLGLFPENNVRCNNEQIPFETESSEIVFSCIKPSESTIQVTMQTSEGNLTGVDVLGYEDAINEIRSQINSLSNSGSLVPKGVIAFFSGEPPCPAGWTEYTELRGRYAVGLVAGGNLGAVVGSALNDRENRPTGNHTHDILNVFQRTPAQYHSGGGSAFDDYPKTLTTTNPNNPASMSFKDGTNAPYVQLTACIKR